MTDDNLEYIKKLMKLADAADGDLAVDGKRVPDGRFHRDVALKYLDVLIERAHKAGCVNEEKHLTAARNMTAKLKDEKLDIPWDHWIKKGFINGVLREKIEKADISGELLQWNRKYPADKNCSAMDYTPPDLSRFKPGNQR